MGWDGFDQVEFEGGGWAEMARCAAGLEVAPRRSLVASLPLLVFFPNTSRSKSSSPTPAPPKELPKEPVLIKSLERVPINPFEELEESSLSLRDCSCSILEEIALMRLMNSENCSRLRRGPILKFQRIGNTSIAR